MAKKKKLSIFGNSYIIVASMSLLGEKNFISHPGFYMETGIYTLTHKNTYTHTFTYIYIYCWIRTCTNSNIYIQMKKNCTLSESLYK